MNNLQTSVKKVQVLQVKVLKKGAEMLHFQVEQGKILSEAKVLNKAKAKNVRLSADELIEAFPLGKSQFNLLVKVAIATDEDVKLYTEECSGSSQSLKGFDAFLQGKDEDTLKTLVSLNVSKSENAKGASIRILEDMSVKINGETALLEAMLIEIQKMLKNA